MEITESTPPDSQFKHFLILSMLSCIILGKPVNAACPLELSPPRVVVRFGDSLSANCTSSSDQTEGMGWESPYGGVDLTDGVTFLPFKIDSVPVWELEPMCYVNSRDGSQCTKVLPVTVYKTPNIVSIYPLNQSQMMEEQYWLRCDIINVAPVQHLTVRWYKNNKTIQTESFNDTTTKTLVNESSILRIDISREEKATEFRCEAELDFGPHGLKLPATSQTHRVSAHCDCTVDISPLEGTNITLSCEAVGNPPPVYNWTCDGENMLENTNSLNIMRINRNKTCTCTATNYLGNISKTINVHITPRGTHLLLLFSCYLFLKFI
uniref:Ig-like domain-containing protein n=1 Tax=Neolamprologus brichardi TaxID=32507 RepID=A0A3Q4GUG9_NEOBR